MTPAFAVNVYLFPALRMLSVGFFNCARTIGRLSVRDCTALRLLLGRGCSAIRGSGGLRRLIGGLLYSRRFGLGLGLGLGCTFLAGFGCFLLAGVFLRGGTFGIATGRRRAG